MSLKYDEVEYLLLKKDIADAVEDLKNGKKHAKGNLYRFVYTRRMSKETYKKIVKRFYKVNVRKNKEWYFYGIPLNKQTVFNALYIIAVIVALCILGDAIELNNFWVDCSLVFLVLSACLYHHSKATDIEDRDRKIAELNQEIKKLNDTRKSDEHIIELLNKELEKECSSCQAQRKRNE